MQEYCGPDLSAHTALVTGAGSGIGLACAERLSAAGAKVVVLDRDESTAHAVADRLGGTAMVADLSEPSIVDGLGLAADILVNNAGLQHVAPIEEFDPDRFTLMQKVMLEAPFRLARVLLPQMYTRGWGRIVHISSVHGHRASPYKSAYVSAKHGLEGLSKVIALEGASRGVTSNTICPGYVRTPLVEGQIAEQARVHGIDESAVLDEVLLARTPIKRLVRPAEVADLVAYLCGPGTDSITGSAFTLDGGWTAT
ncbi:MAG: 3-hydroxybutyrate dehydrogenase [Haloechinothrix sp.]